MSYCHNKSEKPYDVEMSYRAYVKAQCSQNPSLLNLHNFLSSPKVRPDGCRIVAMDFREGIGHPIPRANVCLNDLSSELRKSAFGKTHHEEAEHSRDHPLQGRILIIEDLTKDVVEHLGSELDIDPLFFALHLHTAQKQGMRHQAPDEATLPSRLLRQDYINISYHRAITCDAVDESKRRLLRDTVIDRKLVFLPFTNIGLAQHCASVILTKQESSFWIALVLVDPPIGDTYFLDGGKEQAQNKVRLHSQPFLGVYEDFLDPPPFSRDVEYSSMPLRNGMSYDLAQYWERNIPACFDPQNPTLQSIAFYPLRIVAAEWVKYVAVMHHCLKHYEYGNEGATELERLERNLRELQSWRRRSMLSQQKVQSVLRLLRPRIATDLNDEPSLQNLIADFEFINAKIEDYGRRLESMLPVVTSLVQIIDARRSFAETSNISRLTVLALVFVPLNYVSSLFSMNPINLPGSDRFWVYFVVAIPVTLLVFIIARLPSAEIRKFFVWLKAQRKRPLSSRRAIIKASISKNSQA